jgi:murein DD-endopeptidase MepM/ murein hydrolase activator NlpD
VEGSERKTPSDDALHGGDASAPAVAEAEGDTPQAASIARSRADGEKERAPRGPWNRTWPAPLRALCARPALVAIGSACALAGAVLASQFAVGVAPRALPHVSAVTLGGSLSGLDRALDAGVPDAVSDAPAVVGPARAEPRIWRVSRLAEDPTAGLVDVTVGHRPLLAALGGAGLSRAEAQRLSTSLTEVRGSERFGPKDEFTVALDKATGRVVAYELATSPADVWQGREEPQGDGSLKLETRKLELEVDRVRVRKAVLVGAELHQSFVDAGLAPIDDLLAMVDDALEGHAELSDIRPGARLRIVATQDQVDGAFVRWGSLEAVEYFPATPSAPSVRVYRFGDDDGDDATAKKHHGWYDAKGRQPYHGGWRSPVPLARITSRFNPHRMHPVLHVVMPHNGVDFAAPVGTPVYATAAGTVLSVGGDGPCGNKVEIAHSGNVVSIYCHLSRFAAGLKAGQHVEQRQLIAYVGQTGRVTGPHLHFGIRRNGVVIDPMTLRLDGVRVVPRSLRDVFDRQRAQLDAELDGIALPASSAAATEPPEPDSFYEEP